MIFFLIGGALLVGVVIGFLVSTLLSGAARADEAIRGFQLDDDDAE